MYLPAERGTARTHQPTPNIKWGHQRHLRVHGHFHENEQKKTKKKKKKLLDSVLIIILVCFYLSRLSIYANVVNAYVFLKKKRR